MNVLDVLDGLKERGLLERLESCEVDGPRVSIRFVPLTRTYEPPDTTRIERARDEDDPEGLKYASS